MGDFIIRFFLFLPSFTPLHPMPPPRPATTLCHHLRVDTSLFTLSCKICSFLSGLFSSYFISFIIIGTCCWWSIIYSTCTDGLSRQIVLVKRINYILFIIGPSRVIFDCYIFSLSFSLSLSSCVCVSVCMPLFIIWQRDCPSIRHKHGSLWMFGALYRLTVIIIIIHEGLLRIALRCQSSLFLEKVTQISHGKTYQLDQ